VSGGQELSQLGLAAVASAGVAYGVTELVSGHRMQVALLVAVAVPAILARASRPLGVRWSAVAQVAGALVGVALVGGAGPSALLDGLTSGWSQVLSTTMPADPTPAVVVPLTALVWATSAAASQAVIRATSVFLPIVPVAGGALAARLLEGDNVGRPTFVAACAGVTALVVLGGVRADAGFERPRRGGVRLPFTVPMLPAVFVATAVAVLAGGAVPAALAARDRPFDPRSLREVVPAASDVDNPLSMVRSARRQRDPEMAQITTSSPGGAVAVYLRLVALDRYDGSTWSATSQYRVAGEHLPRTPAGGPSTVVLDQDVVVKGLSTPWLAVADRPVRLQGMPVLHDANQGTLLATARQPLHPEQRYRATSLVPRVDPSGLANAMADTGGALEPYRTLPPGLPPEFSAAAQAAVASAVGSDFARLAGLQSYFTDGYAIQDAEAGGQSVAQLARFIAPDRRVAPSSAEFAAAFALLARTLGYASRVVVGFAPFPAGGSRILRRGDLHAWPEVALRGFGWVPFEPTPVDRSDPARPEVAVPVDSPADLAKKVAADQSGPSPTGTGPGHGDPAASPRRARLLRWALGLGGAFGGTVLLLLGPMGLKARRRRRRRKASVDPAQRVLGAWAEALDRLAERGVARDRTATSRDVVDRTSGRLGPAVAPPVHEIGSLATMAIAAPPGSLDPSHGEGAWTAAEQLTRALQSTGSLGDRARAAIDPRPLLRRSRS